MGYPVVSHHHPQGPDFGNRVHAPVLFLAQQPHPLEAGELLAPEIAPLEGFELRHQLIHGVHIIGVLEPVDDEQVFGFRLPEQVGQFRALVIGVHREQHGPIHLRRGLIARSPSRPAQRSRGNQKTGA